MTGLLGFASGYRAMEDCDVLLMLGTDFPYQQFFPEDAVKIQVDLRGEQLGRRTPIDVGLVGTVRETAAVLLPLLERKSSRDHLEKSLKRYRKSRSGLDDLATNDRNRAPIHPQYLTRLVDELAADDAVFLPDVGSPVVWASRYLKMNGRRRLIGSFSHGSMANAVSQGIGAQASDSETAGDRAGGRRRTHHDARRTAQPHPEPAAREDRRVQQLVAQLRRVGDEGRRARQLRHRTGEPELRRCRHCDGNPRRSASSDRTTSPAPSQTAFAHDGPALVDVVTARQELSMPPAITAEQAKGFTLYAIRTVLSGRGEELIDLAHTNVVRRILD